MKLQYTKSIKAIDHNLTYACIVMGSMYAEYRVSVRFVSTCSYLNTVEGMAGDNEI